MKYITIYIEFVKLNLLLLVLSILPSRMRTLILLV